jgi:hypothetical protein
MDPESLEAARAAAGWETAPVSLASRRTAAGRRRKRRRRPIPLKKTPRRWDDSETARRAASRLDSVVRQLGLAIKSAHLGRGVMRSKLCAAWG